MNNVLYVPKLSTNLFSVREAASNGNVTSFGRRCWIRSKRNRLVGVGSLVGKLYKLDCKIVPCLKQAAHVTKEDNQKTNLWYKRLAHVNIQQLRQLSTIADGIDIPSNGKYDFCEACVEAKIQRKPHHPLNEVRSTEPLQLILSDVCGPMQTESIGGSRYFITFIDDHQAVSTASYLRNRMVTTALQSKFTPYQLWFGKKPDLRRIRVFGCVVYSHVWEGNTKKLDKKAHKLRFIGYTETTKNYTVFDEEKRRCYVRHDLIFNENDYGGKEINNSESIEETNTEIDNEEMLIEREVEVHEENQELLDQEEQPTLLTALSQQQITPAQDEEPTSQPPRRFERSRKPPVRYGHDDYANQACGQASKIVEPATIEEAFQSHNSKEWKRSDRCRICIFTRK